MKNYILIILCMFCVSCVPMVQPSFDDETQATRLVDEGLLHLRVNDLERAEASFNLALELVVSAAAIDGLGCVAFMREDYNAAEKLFWEAYETDRTYNNPLSNLALVYEKTGNKQKAREMYDRALKEDPKNFRMRNNYAVHLVEDNASKDEVSSELFKAQALFNHRLIYGNIATLKEK